MSRNARVSAPQRTTIDSSAATTPASATPPRCDLLSRGGSTSSTRTTAAAASTMNTGSSAPTITAERHPLVHPQQVDGREDDAGRGDGGQGPAHLEGADQHQELADEPVEPGQAQRGQRDDEKQRRERRDDLPQPAELRDQSRVTPL